MYTSNYVTASVNPLSPSSYYNDMDLVTSQDPSWPGYVLHMLPIFLLTCMYTSKISEGTDDICENINKIYQEGTQSQSIEEPTEEEMM